MIIITLHGRALRRGPILHLITITLHLIITILHLTIITLHLIIITLLDAVRLKCSIGLRFSRAPKVDTEDPEGAATVRRRAAHAPIAPASAEVKVDLEKHGERLQYTF